MLDNYKEGKVWAEKTVSLYLEQLQPYYLLAQEKTAQGAELALLGYKKVGVLAAAGVDKLEETLPGAMKQLEFVQNQFLAAYDFVRGYINDMKSK